MSILNLFVDRPQLEEATKALLAGQEEYRLPRQIISNQTGTYQYMAKLDTREGEKGVLVEIEVNTYEEIKGEWHVANSMLEFAGFYPLSVITQQKHL